jgi:hypothetical protein
LAGFLVFTAGDEVGCQDPASEIFDKFLKKNAQSALAGVV